VRELTYWKISGGYKPGEVIQPFKPNDGSLEQAIATADDSFRALVAAFDDPARAYLCRPAPGAAPRFSDYATLARVAEWSVGEEE
jgi:ATP-dependent helicase/nuclease subunit B